MSATVHEPAVERNGAGAYLTPLAAESETFDLPVTGTIPAELRGRFVRNGPNPRSGRAEGHPFLADGMLHGLRIEDGAARWYRNRWVRTKSFTTGAKYVNWFGKVDLEVGTANTNAIAHGGKLLALVESSFPYEMTRGARHRRAVGFSQAAQDAVHRAPEAVPANRRAARVRDGVQPRRADLSSHRRGGNARREPPDTGSRRDDDARLRAHRAPRRVHGSADGLRHGSRETRRDAVRVERDVRRPLGRDAA